MKLNKEDIKETISTLAHGFEKELFDKSETELEKYWHFDFDKEVIYQELSQQLYDFHKALDLYGSLCRRWEEYHNGHILVVERVRDKYLMPKITKFIKKLQEVY